MTEDLLEASCTVPEPRPPEVEAKLELPDELKPPETELPQLRALLGVATLTSGLYSTLRARGNQYGRYIRPDGRCSNPPPAGTSISWVLCQPNQDNVQQKRELGWGNLGTIGNADHLRGCGDHTGHSSGKQTGVVYADDTSEPDWVEQQLIAICRLDDYDTRWIHFFNVNGSQYNYAGERVASSADHHLHISTREGFELISHTLLVDCDRRRRGLPLLRGKTVAEQVNINPLQNFKFWPNSWVLKYYAAISTITDGVTLQTWGPESWAYARRLVEESEQRHAEMIAQFAALSAKLDGADGETIQQVVRAELVALESRLNDRFAALGADVAAKVSGQFGEEIGEFVAGEFFEALAAGRQQTEPQ